MAQSFEFELSLSNISRGVTDNGWESIDLDHIKIWEQAQEVLSHHEIASKHGPISITFSFLNVIERLKFHHQVMKYITTPISDRKGKKIDFRQDRVIIPINVKANLDKSPPLDRFHVESHISNIVHNIFLIFNISAPSSCDLWRASLAYDEKNRSEFRLSNHHFDVAFMESFDGKWPKLSILNVNEVKSWILSIRSGYNQIPKNPAEKTLFSLLHLCNLDVSPISVIWVFYALETLFDTKPGVNFNLLLDRMSILLKPNERQRSYLRKRLRKLYDLRSALVHGGLEVVHPMNDDSLDADVGDAAYEYIQAGDFGLSLIVASIQSLIHRGWQYPEFSELMTGPGANCAEQNG